MIQPIRFLGLDVHKATVTGAVADTVGTVTELGTVPNTWTAVRKLADRVQVGGARLLVAYEAGPTGYALQRSFASVGIQCLVIAPSLIPRPAGRRIKTDRRDAVQLARLLRSGDLTAVWVPDPQLEALRDLVRARNAAQADAVRAGNRVGKFLLAKGITPPQRMSTQSQKYELWLRTINLPHPADQIAFADACATLSFARERVRRLTAGLHQCAQRSPHAELIAALQAFRGIGPISAVTIAAEAGDLRRFPTAPQFMAYVGLVPSEHSSGPSHVRGHITRTGNRFLRHVLGEAAHHARRVPAMKRSQPAAPEIATLAWRAQQRLHFRYRTLAGRRGRQVALTAVARELAGFIWAAGRLVPEAAPVA